MFISNIYVYGNLAAAHKMHSDLSPNSNIVIANIKVIICLVCGILYLLEAYGILNENRKFLYSGIAAFIIFDGFYIAELLMWGATHLMVWFGFAIFGGLSFVYALYSWIKIKHVA